MDLWNILQAVALKLHGVEVEVKVVQSKSDTYADHVQFLIEEKKGSPSFEELMISTDASTVTNFGFLSPGRWIRRWTGFMSHNFIIICWN